MKGFKNTWIVTEEGLKKTSFTYDQHFITIGKDEEGLEELPEDYVIVPGFIDEHVHGAAGSDAMDGTKEDLKRIATALASEGTSHHFRIVLGSRPVSR